jgi:hypothetical protein
MNLDDFLAEHSLPPEEAERMTLKFNNYYSALKSGLKEIVEEFDLQLEFRFSMKQTPIESCHDILYDKEVKNIDSQIQELLYKINKEYNE